MPNRDSPNLIGVFWMLVTGAFFVGVTVVVKHLGSDLPAAESAFLRYAIGLIFVIPLLPAMRRHRPDRLGFGLIALRGLAHTLGVILWFYSMSRIPLAEVTAMNYLAPVYVMIGAALFLGDKLSLRRMLAVALALIGTLIILRPGFREISDGHLAMLGTGFFLGSSYLIAKKLTDQASPGVVVGWLSVAVTIGLAPFAWAVWVPPSLEEVLWIALVALFATGGHFTMGMAFRAAPISVTQPVTFLQIVWATLIGALVFGEAVDAFVILGSALIVAAVSYTSWREAVARRAVAAP
ncbi:MAG: EamA family transporter [Rhodobacteraceae bacterium]|nr:EamA family transporter [Paracoccaceae bacterium]